MYSNIIVPLAFDEDHNPDTALNVARALASDGARITLVHVMADVPGYAISYMPEGYATELRQTLQQQLDGLAADFEAGAGVIRQGNAANEILDLAEEIQADCIVIASHRPGFGDYLIGSTAARVVRHAPCSVMVLR
ncbi:universal stress protein [Sinirhodobacter huangdaonensis]|uniref:Universal stress protein n=1 Tax=Paenirhodobacter huangdaonensis TaxID=2501515 RepID=A0A443LS65_9RHOB|nr:universal stress protein [Sinirhodobacter huangdaonensis]RWR52013.1 universal stress protein [Sinirhodobacter huangdaonensis]